MADLHELSALDQAALVRRGEVSAPELVRHHLERVERLGPRVGAFVTVTADRALAAAQHLPAGAGPLRGVPTAIKDLVPTAGVRTTFGSVVFADHVPDTDAHVVSLLRAAGTVSLGKTNTPELGLPNYTEPEVAPAARSPWDPTRTACGSSGGAAAAVAAGLVPVAHGNDGGGSVRNPAAACGVVGLKPSRGRVSNGPLGADLAGLACQGVLARTVADAAAYLDAMAVPMPGDPWWAPPLPPGTTFLAAAGRAPGRLRIGRYATPLLADVPLAPEVTEAWESVSRLLADLGHDVADVDPPFTRDDLRHFETLWAVLATPAPIPPGHEARLRPLTRWMRERGRAVAAADYVAAEAALQRLAREAVTRTAGYDAVLTPLLSTLPPAVGSIRDDADPAADFAAQKRLTPFAAAYNVTGQPAIALPLHWTGDGLPVGVQLVGRPAGEAGLLSLAAQLEAARPWHDRRPEVW